MKYIRFVTTLFFLSLISASIYGQEYLNTSHFYSIDGHLIQLHLDSVLRFELYSDNDTVYYTTGNSKSINGKELAFTNFTNHFDKTKSFEQFDKSNPIVKYLMINPSKEKALTRFKINAKYLTPYYFNNSENNTKNSINDTVQFSFSTKDLTLSIHFYANDKFEFTIKTPVANYAVLGDYYSNSNVIIISSQDKNKNLLRLLSTDGKLEIFDNLLICATSLKGIGTAKSQYIYLLKSE